LNLLRFAAVFMLFLVLSLPVCIAQSLEIESFAGKDNVQNYARPDDDVTMNVKAMIPRDLVISDSQVKVCRGGSCSYPSCSPGESFKADVFNECIYKETLADEKGIFPYTVQLFDDDNNPVKTLSTELGIDKVPPNILNFRITPPATKDAAVIEIDAQDYGSEKGDASYCAGIKQVDFYDEATGTVLFTKEFGYEECDISDSFEYRHQTKEKSEKLVVCAKAIDLFNQESEPVCRDFVYDEEGPKFISLGMADTEGNPISHITSSGADVEMVVEIDDASDLSAVTADLSKISGKSSDKSRKFNYKKDGLFYWSGFRVNPGTVCSVDVRAVDALDNSANASLSCDVLVDDAGPEVQELMSSYEDYTGSYIMAPGTQIKARILEPGVGLHKHEVYLDLSEVNLGTLQADYCEKKSDKLWVCYWNDITPEVRDGDYQIRITGDSRDDLGNPVLETAGLDVETYTKAARITAISQYPVSPSYEDTLEFTLRVENAKTEPSVFVDASQISSDAFPKQALCTGAGIEEWECSVDVGMLNQVYMKEMITFSTKGDSMQEVPFEVTVYEPEPAGRVDFYTITATSVMPRKGFDKSMMESDIPVPVYLQPRLKKKAPDSDMSILETSADCTAEGASDVYLVQGNPEKPYIVVKGSSDLADQDTPVKVDCTLSLRLREGERVFKNLETESFSVNIPVYGNPLGTIDENAKAQITAMDDRVWDLQKRTTRWSDVNDWVGTIVWLAQSLAQMDSTNNYIGSILWLVAVVLYELRVIKPLGIGDACKAASKFLWKTVACSMLTDLNMLVLDYVWNPGMIGSEIFSAKASVAAEGLWTTLIKTVSIIYSCQMCDYSSSLYAGTKKIIYGDTSFDIGASRGKPTEIERFTVYDWDPYRSMHIAMGCLCIPGIVYNMRKEVQVNCIYRNCIEQNAELGLPFDSCQQTFKEQNCLYVDGAAWRVAGGSGIAFTLNSLLTVILDQLPMMVTSKAWSMVCDPDCGMFGKEQTSEEKNCGEYGLALNKGSGESAYPDKCRDYPEDDWRVPFCALWTGTMLLQETDFFGTNKFGWDRYYAELEGEDYCD